MSMARKPLPRTFIPPAPVDRFRSTGVLEYGQQQIGPRRRWISRKWRYIREEAGIYAKCAIMGLPIAILFLVIVLRWVLRIWFLVSVGSH